MYFHLFLHLRFFRGSNDLTIQVGHIEGVMSCLHECFHDDEVVKGSQFSIESMQPRIENKIEE